MIFTEGVGHLVLDRNSPVVDGDVPEKRERLVFCIHTVDLRAHLLVDLLDRVGHDLHDLACRHLVACLLRSRATDDVFSNRLVECGDGLLVLRDLRGPALGLGDRDFHPAASVMLRVMFAGGSPWNADRWMYSVVTGAFSFESVKTCVPFVLFVNSISAAISNAGFAAVFFCVAATLSPFFHRGWCSTLGAERIREDKP